MRFARSIFSSLPCFVAVCVVLLAVPSAQALDYVRITAPADGGTIPLAPGSVGVTGAYKGPAGTITVKIYAANLENNEWVPVGSPLSTGSTAVSGWTITGPNSWAVTLNSPATNAGNRYVMYAVYDDTNGNNVDESDYNVVTSK